MGTLSQKEGLSDQLIVQYAVDELPKDAIAKMICYCYLELLDMTESYQIA